jgi:hypothetical protein
MSARERSAALVMSKEDLFFIMGFLRVVYSRPRRFQPLFAGRRVLQE